MANNINNRDELVTSTGPSQDPTTVTFDVPLTKACRAFYTNADGSVSFIAENGFTATLACAAGSLIPIRVTQFLSAGSTLTIDQIIPLE